MNIPCKTIVVAVRGQLHSPRGLRLSEWLARRLGARLVECPLEEMTKSAAEVVLHVSEHERADLIVVEAETTQVLDDTECGDLDPATRTMIERSESPVLVLPPNYREVLPWGKALVPVSGEAEIDCVLTQAVQFAAALDLEVHVAHVVAPGHSDDPMADPRYADAPHHEYPHRFEELITRALPVCRSDQTGCISDIALCPGTDIAAELGRLIEERKIGLLVIGWHGRFAHGHAAVLRTLLRYATLPLLLLRAVPRQHFSLRIGDALEE